MDIEGVIHQFSSAMGRLGQGRTRLDMLADLEKDKDKRKMLRLAARSIANMEQEVSILIEILEGIRDGKDPAEAGGDRVQEEGVQGARGS